MVCWTAIVQVCVLAFTNSHSSLSLYAGTRGHIRSGKGSWATRILSHNELFLDLHLTLIPETAKRQVLMKCIYDTDSYLDSQTPSPNVYTRQTHASPPIDPCAASLIPLQEGFRCIHRPAHLGEMQEPHKFGLACCAWHPRALGPSNSYRWSLVAFRSTHGMSRHVVSCLATWHVATCCGMLRQALGHGQVRCALSGQMPTKVIDLKLSASLPTSPPLPPASTSRPSRRQVSSYSSKVQIPTEAIGLQDACAKSMNGDRITQQRQDTDTDTHTDTDTDRLDRHADQNEASKPREREGERARKEGGEMQPLEDNPCRHKP